MRIGISIVALLLRKTVQSHQGRERIRKEWMVALLQTEFRCRRRRRSTASFLVAVRSLLIRSGNIQQYLPFFLTYKIEPVNT